MHAVILDIDGTLLESDIIDDQLYRKAIQRVLGTVRMRENWAAYQHVTDSGILAEVFRDNGVPPDDRRSSAIQRAFVDSLERYIAAHGPFREIPGAREFVARLCAATDYACAYATGGWAASARLKLMSAGFPLQGIPLSSSDDAPDRCTIMENALVKLGGRYDTTTYYGDGEWDRRAADQLGWQFVPVGSSLGGIQEYTLQVQRTHRF